MENSPSGLPGFDVEFLREAFDRVGIPLEIQYMPWKRALDTAKKGEVSGVCSCSYTKEREAYLLFSEPLGKASSGLFSLASQNFEEVQGLEEVGKRSVGAINGYNLIKKLEAAKVQRTFELSSEKQGLQMLLKGRIDFYYSYEAPARYYLSQLQDAQKVKYQELSSTDYYSCFSKPAPGSAELLKKFNRGLAEIKADGTYDAILKKYR